MPFQTFSNTENIFTLISPISNDCLSEDCNCKPLNEGIFASYNNHIKSFGNPNVDDLEYRIKRPTIKQIDEYAGEELIDFGKREYLDDKKVLVGCSISAIKRIENVTRFGDCEDVGTFNRARRNNAIKSVNQLKIATFPFEFANFDLFNFQIEKYFKNKCNPNGYYISQPLDFGVCAYLEPNNINGFAVKQTTASSYYWHSSNTTLVNATSDGIYSGASNTDLIVSTYGSENNVAKIAKDYTHTTQEGVTYDDYYLPSKTEMELIGGNYAQLGIELRGVVWTSTEYNSQQAWAYSFLTNTSFLADKTNLYELIVIKKF
jgi:hypothetical protein